MNMNKNIKMNKKFGTFEGVFTPTVLTILGVILYLRLGWVVGNAGLGGALLIILMANIVTIITGLSIAAIASNIKIGAGGLYALISRSLGPEIGSAIGIPLFLSQALSAALYIVGFSEGWLSIFPEHNALLVSSLVLLVLFLVSFIGAKIAMKIQFIILSLIVLSLFSFFAGQSPIAREIVIWGDFQKADFWKIFAIFFPAVTGIAAGAAMSGDLRNSRKSMPFGIVSGVLITMVVYIAVAFWYDYQANSDELVNNYTIILKLSRWPVLILGGILGATLSSALGSIMGSPRTLLALGQDKVIPFSKYFAKLSKNGEPRFSLFLTVVFVEICLLLGDLNSLAPLLTMFFLITYGILNFAVAIEKGIGIPSFRPSLNVPTIIPILGGIWCFIVMFLINPLFAGVALVFIAGFYIIQIKRGLTVPWSDVRGGLFNAIAEWAAKTSTRLPVNEKTWKPNLLIPIEDPRRWRTIGSLIRDIIYPSGTVRFFSINVKSQNKIFENIPLIKDKSSRGIEGRQDSSEILDERLKEFVKPLKDEGIFTAETAIECDDLINGLSVITQTTKGMFFPPNTMFLTISKDRAKDERLNKIIQIAHKEHLGICIYAQHPVSALGNRKIINVWLRQGSPNRNLALLIAIQLKKNWQGLIRLILVINREEDRDQANRFLNKIDDKARMPHGTEISVLVGDFQEVLANCPVADLNIFGMTERASGFSMNQLMELSNYSCIFVKDSGNENILA